MANGLARRVNDTATQQRNGSGNGGGKEPTLRDKINQMRGEIARAVPKHLDPDRVARIAVTLVGNNPQLARCTPNSFLGALMTASQLGLEPGPLGEAYLVPYGDQCTFIPGYRGLIKLAWQSGQLKHIDAHEVCEGDDFDFAYGLEPFLHHKPARRQRGEVTDVYACATFLNGGSAFVVMSVEDVEAIRARSKASKNGPWITDWAAMAKKTAIKQLAKWLPMSSELRNFGQALAMDGSARTDVAAPVDEVVPNYLEGEIVPTAPGEQEPVEDAAPAETEAAAEPEPVVEGGGKLSKSQATKLNTLLGKCGVSDRDERLRVVSVLAGRELGSTSDVTGDEFDAVLAILEPLVAQHQPEQALDAVLAELQEQQGGLFANGGGGQ